MLASVNFGSATIRYITFEKAAEAVIIKPRHLSRSITTQVIDVQSTSALIWESRETRVRARGNNQWETPINRERFTREVSKRQE